MPPKHCSAGASLTPELPCFCAVVFIQERGCDSLRAQNHQCFAAALLSRLALHSKKNEELDAISAWLEWDRAILSLPLMSQVAMVTLLDPVVLELDADESLEFGNVFCNVNSICH